MRPLTFISSKKISGGYDSRARTGIRKLSVLPLPVSEATTASEPDSSTGTERRWISGRGEATEGLVMPREP